MPNAFHPIEVTVPTITVAQRSSVGTTTRHRLNGSILLATDGTTQSSGAFAAAVGIAATAARRGEGLPPLPVHVVTVSDALSVLNPEMNATLPQSYHNLRRFGMLANAAEQLRYNVADRADWSVEALSGAVAPTLVTAAVESGASLIVMGLGRHQLVDRIFGTETALRVMQRSPVPVLAVPQNWIGIPRRLLVAVDFGPASLRAARAAMQLVAPGGAVHFAHVESNADASRYDDEVAATFQTRLFEDFDRFVTATGVPDDVTITRTPLYGETAPALLGWASAHCADLIVAGTHGLNPLARLLVGSVASKLVRGAHCAVLVSPARDDRGWRGTATPECPVRI